MTQSDWIVSIEVLDSKCSIPNGLFDKPCSTVSPWFTRALRSQDIFSVLDQSGPKTKPHVTPQILHHPPHRSLDWRVASLYISEVNTNRTSASAEMDSPHGTFVGNGIIRVYRESNVRAGEPQQDLPPSSQEPVSQTMAIVAVPSYLTPSELCSFLGPQTLAHSTNIRMLKTSKTYRYMVLIHFGDCESSDRFRHEFNGKSFNSMEAETCHVVPVSSIEFHCVPCPANPAPSVPAQVSSSVHELPTCPVCLERMDASVTGLLTILCDHTFHCRCLSNWSDGSCPVCRYSSQSSKKNSRASPQQSCKVCGSSGSVWMCLICGHAGCSRYDKAHAHDHYVATGHCYAIDISSQRVWDYAQDGYVHRLVQTEIDGKLVELPEASHKAASNSLTAASSSDALAQKKAEDMGMQYSASLTSQLESQRTYYETKLAETSDRAAQEHKRAEKCAYEMERLKSEVQRPKEAKKETETLKKNLARMQELCAKLQSAYKDEKALSEQMLNKLQAAKTEKSALEAQIEDLQDQVRDLMFYLESQVKLEGVPEARGGDLVLKQEAQKHGRGNLGK